jgi:hypothetical protein
MFRLFFNDINYLPLNAPLGLTRGEVIGTLLSDTAGCLGQPRDM